MQANLSAAQIYYEAGSHVKNNFPFEEPLSACHMSAHPKEQAIQQVFPDMGDSVYAQINWGHGESY